MGILSGPKVLTGEIGVKPVVKRLVTTDNLSTITTAGYLNTNLNEGESLRPSDLLLVIYNYDEVADSGDIDFFSISISNGVITLAQDISGGNVVLPTIANHIATYVGTDGQITDDAATAINGGNIQAGLSGTAGYLASFPSAASKGSLRLTAVANTGDTLTTISNAAMGQASVISIPDPGQATAEFIISDSAGTQHVTSGALQVDAGAISSGLAAGGFVGVLNAYPTTASSGVLSLQAAVNATGDFDTTISNATAVAQDQVISIPDSGQATSEFLLADSGGTQHVTSGGLQVDAGIVSSGLAAGGFVGEFDAYPTTASSGILSLKAVDNATGDFDTVISNAAAVAQDQVVTVPDSGGATANFILSASSAAAQTISSGLSITGNNNVQTSGGGQFFAGSSGSAGYFGSYPTTASNGSLILQAVDNAGGDFSTTINNAASVGQDQAVVIPDVGAATGYFQVSATPSDPSSNLLWVDVTVDQSDLATGGTKTLVASSGTKQYKIREIYLNAGGTNFAGGGGDRLGEISDGTSSYSVIPAANMQSLTNDRWGSTAVAYPASVAINTSTAAGADIVFQYNGGGTDYTSGSLVVSLLVERVA